MRGRSAARGDASGQGEEHDNAPGDNGHTEGEGGREGRREGAKEDTYTLIPRRQPPTHQRQESTSRKGNPNQFIS